MCNYKKNLAQQENAHLKGLNIHSKEHLSFSFKYFREIENFGVGDCDTQWFASLLDAIIRYSGMNLSEIVGRESFRYHAIKWEQHNIPIKFEDLDWLPKNEQLLVSAGDVYQLSISQGTGRIIGFSVGSTFYVVLLDPKHNLQPSKSYNYRVDPTKHSETQYEELKRKYDLLLKSAHNTLDASLIEQITLSSPQNNILFVGLSDDDMNNYFEYCCDISISGLIEEHAFYYLEKEKTE